MPTVLTNHFLIPNQPASSATSFSQWIGESNHVVARFGCICPGCARAERTKPLCGSAQRA
jgi:hypothetical protein